MPDKIKTRLLLISDTHARAPSPFAAKDFSCRWPLPSADVAIHTGDLTLTGRDSEHRDAIDLLKRLRADLKIVIPGNHDLTLDIAYYEAKGGIHGPRPKYKPDQLEEIRNLYTGPEAQAANIVYLEEGTRTFELKNGARLSVYASAYTPEFCQWAFAYERDQDRYNSPSAENPVPTYNDNESISKTSTNIDVMLTHGPPMGILDAVIDRLSGGAEINVGCEHLLRAVARARPLLHCFGHIHEGWGAVRKTWHGNGGKTLEKEISAEDAMADTCRISVDNDKVVEEMGAHVDVTNIQRGHETLFVNASIMDLKYRPVQGPWMVDLLLDKRN